MAENIYKVYPGGIWYNDTLEKRYERIVDVLEKYTIGHYDVKDVAWFIKCAIINNIYISETVYKNKCSVFRCTSKRMQYILAEICKQGYTSYKSIDIRKYFKANVVFEHIIPFNIVRNELIKLYKNKELTFDKFNEIRLKINICIITAEEDSLLTKEKLRNKMPTNWNFQDGDEFARYTAVGIKIYKK